MLGRRCRGALAIAAIVLVTLAGPVSAPAAPAVPWTVRLVVVPLRAADGSVPDPADVAGLGPALDAWAAAATGGTLRFTATVAPVDDAPEPAKLLPPDVPAFERLIRRALARGAPVDDALVVFLYRPELLESRGLPGAAAFLYGESNYRNPSVVAHEVGHALGLDHARGARCSTPDPVGCGDEHADEYGDRWDAMGSGSDAFSAFSLASLGVEEPLDVTGREPRIVALRPAGAGPGSSLRLRTHLGDWLVETRRPGLDPPIGTGGVLVQRVEAAYTRAPGVAGAKPRRLLNPRSTCEPGGFSGCDPAGYVWSPGDGFELPGVVRAAVVEPDADGRPQLEVEWLDPTPLRLRVDGGLLERPWGGGSATARLGVRVAGAGAGVDRVEVTIAGRRTVLRGAAIGALLRPVRDDATEDAPRTAVLALPAAGSARTAQVRVVDAAGNASTASVALRPVRRVAVRWSPSSLTAAHDDVLTPTVRAGSRLVVRLRTDPGLAGSSCPTSLELVDDYTATTVRTVRARIGRGGVATISVVVPRTPLLRAHVVSCTVSAVPLPEVVAQLRLRVLWPEP